MGSRPELQTQLETLLGSRNVYFQPPASVMMRYPAIRYSPSNIEKLNANNASYKLHKSYELTLIDSNPDSEFVDKILALPMCSFGRYYTADNLNHWTFTLYH